MVSIKLCGNWDPSKLVHYHEHCKEHFQGEERNLLPLMEATELSREQQERVLEQCLDAMQGTHSHLFCFFLESLCPRDALQYSDLITRRSDRERVTSMLHVIVE
ncbi:hypothetical protein F0562_025684 [Nyssa sinensis]|uniref:Hemerythrin-like domain-containing protein n=1 Tax=Nyssa sinensis TaxID=561372 RepID=A0A5J5BAS8_9ASTE|nr:hypothetical protein F0562_025684 [Nyssa sinensis]